MRHLRLHVHLNVVILMIILLVKVRSQLALVPKINGALSFLFAWACLNLNLTKCMIYRILPNCLLNGLIFLPKRIGSRYLLLGVVLCQIMCLIDYTPRRNWLRTLRLTSTDLAKHGCRIQSILRHAHP